jgi:ABC-type polysaccharide/polyol phosphate export permease
MNDRLFAYMQTLGSLIYRDLVIFKQGFVGKFIDTVCLLVTTIMIFAYFLPAYGLGGNHVSFVVIGAIAGFSFFEVYGRISMMIADMEGDKSILYTLTLPVPPALVFIYMGISWAILSSITGLLLFPLAKLFLGSSLNLSQMSIIRFIPMFILNNLFFGFFCLWLCSLLKKMGSIAHLFPRALHPMFMFGGYLYSWQTVYSISPALSYVHLLNPLLYVMEGTRASILGPEGNLSFFSSFNALLVFTLFFACDGVKRLLRRLDCAFP